MCRVDFKPIRAACERNPSGETRFFEPDTPTRLEAVLTSASGANQRGRFYARVARLGDDRAQLHFNVTYTAVHGEGR